MSRKLSNFSTLSKTFYILGLCTAMLLAQSCGKKGKKPSTSGPQIKESVDGRSIVVDPLAARNFTCSGKECPKGIVKIFNFNSGGRYKSCLGAMIGGNKVITTATCIGSFEDQQKACENLFLKTLSQKTPIKCKKILEMGLPATSYTYLRRKDFAIIEIEEPEEKEAIIISSQKLKNAYYPLITVYKDEEMITQVGPKYCMLTEPSQSSINMDSELNRISTFNIDCHGKYKQTEGSLIINPYGQLVAIYSRGKRMLKPNIISLGCIKSEIVPILDGENCPVYERQQTDQSFDDKKEEFLKKEKVVTNQSFTSSLFRWDIYQYGKTKLYEPICYLDFKTTKRHIRGFLNTKTNFYTSFNTYRMNIHNNGDVKSISIEPVRLDAVINSKKFGKTKMLKIKYSEHIKIDQLQDYLDGKHVHRSTKVLKSCKETDK